MTRDLPPAHLSRALVRAFEHLLAHPAAWHSAAEIARAAQVGEATVYRRFAALAAGGAVDACRIGDLRRWRLRPDWQRCSLAAELQRRATVRAPT